MGGCVSWIGILFYSSIKDLPPSRAYTCLRPAAEQCMMHHIMLLGFVREDVGASLCGRRRQPRGLLRPSPQGHRRTSKSRLLLLSLSSFTQRTMVNVRGSTRRAAEQQTCEEKYREPRTANHEPRTDCTTSLSPSTAVGQGRRGGFRGRHSTAVWLICSYALLHIVHLAGRLRVNSPLVLQVLFLCTQQAVRQDRREHSSSAGSPSIRRQVAPLE